MSMHCSLKKVVTSESGEMSIVSSMNANSDVRARLRGGPSPPTPGSSCVMSICILFASAFVSSKVRKEAPRKINDMWLVSTWGDFNPQVFVRLIY